jgi:hypothetical protein
MGEQSLADDYDYVCHGKVYRFEEGHEHSPGSVKISVRKNLDISDQTHMVSLVAPSSKTLDVNTELYPCAVGESLSLALASTLSLDGKEDTKVSSKRSGSDMMKVATAGFSVYG